MGTRGAFAPLVSMLKEALGRAKGIWKFIWDNFIRHTITKNELERPFDAKELRIYDFAIDQYLIVSLKRFKRVLMEFLLIIQ